GFDGRVLVGEQAPGYRQASTSLSVGGVRHQFSTEQNIAMSLYATQFLRAIGTHLAVDDWVPDVSLRENGYLFLASAAGRDVLAHNFAEQTRLGADIDWLEPDALSQRFPGLAVDDIAAGTYGASGEGWLDPYALLQAFKRKARALGVTYIEDKVVDVSVDATRVRGVVCAQSGAYACGTLINAAGAGAAGVAAMAGIDDLP